MFGDLLPSVMQFSVYVCVGLVIGSMITRMQDSELKYRELFRYSPNAVCLADLASKEITEMNPRFRETFGIIDTTSALVPFGTVFSSPDRVDEIVGRLWHDKPVSDQEVSVQRQDGSHLDLTVNATRLAETGSAVFTFTDITRRKQDEEQALASSEKKYRTLVELAQEGIWATDADGLTTYVNPKVGEILGYPQEEMMGRSLYDFMGEKSWIIAHDAIDGKKTPAGPEQEFEFIRKDGTRIITNLSTSPVTDQHGNFTGAIALVSDITERKHYEEQLKSSLEEKSVLLMEIHHRVKNNLQIISGLIRLQSRHITSPPALDALRECENRVITMALVHESLYQAGNLANIRAKRHFTNLATTLLMSDDGAHQIRLDLDIEDLLLDLDTAIPCSLVVNELVINAIKYAFRGRGNGTVRIGLHKKQGDLLELTVSDDGVGFPAGLDIATTTSLGLKLVGRLVRDQLKGTVLFEQRNGTTAIITFGYTASADTKGAEDTGNA
jgi:PAS domain S-box-containing protein